MKRRLYRLIIAFATAVLPSVPACAASAADTQLAYPFMGTAMFYVNPNGNEAVIKNIRNVLANEAAFNAPSNICGEVSLPASVDGLSIVEIGNKAFKGCDRMTSLRIPEGVRSIADEAFVGCTNLVEVVFPSTITNVGTKAFSGCSKLSSLTILAADGLRLGESAFSGCQQLRRAELGGNRLNIGVRCFERLSGLTTVGFRGVSNLVVQTSAFLDCSGLSEFTPPDGTVEIGDSAFKNCAALPGFEVPATVQLIGKEAFSGCSSLTRLSFADQSLVVTNRVWATPIGERAFYDCTGLNWVDLSTNVTEIGKEAFRQCRKLSVLSIPSSVRKIGNSAFAECSSLEGAFIDARTDEIGESAFYACSALRYVNISTNVSAIGTRCFYGCSALRFADVHEGLTRVGHEAFIECSSLEEMIFPASLESVGTNAFWMCTSLGDVRFLDSTNHTGSVKIGEYGFFYCTALTNLELSARVTQLGTATFFGCRSLPRVSLSQKMTVIPEDLFGHCAALASVNIPSNTTTVGESAFNACAALMDFTLPATIRTLGADAFLGTGYWNAQPDGPVYKDGYLLGKKGACPSKIVIPEGVFSIPEGAFRDEAGLEEVVLPTTLKRIGAYAFYRSGIQTVNIPDSVAEIGAYAFYGCSGLASVDYPKSASVDPTAFIGTALTENAWIEAGRTLRESYPQTYDSIISVVIPDGVVGIVDSAFAGCSSLRQVEIPDGVTNIGANAFANCASLTSVVMPASVTTVGTNAFSGCTAIQSAVLSGHQSVSNLFPFAYQRLSMLSVAADATELCNNFLAGCKAVTTFDIPDSVTSIGARAFADCSALDFALLIPRNVDHIGDEAFACCTGLRTVRYLGEEPSVGANIYKGTRGDFITGVLKDNADSWGSPLPTYWPEGDKYHRQIGWWTGESLATISFINWDGCAENTVLRMLADGRHVLDEDVLPDEPERDGYSTDGYWYLAPTGGKPVEFPLVVTGSVKLYRHWILDGEYESGDDDDDEEEEDEDAYDWSAHTFVGYLTDGDAFVGTFELKAAKGKYNRADEACAAKLTATVQLLGESKVKLSGMLDDSLGATLTPSKKSDEREMEVSIETGETLLTISGSFDGYELVGVEDAFAGKSLVARSIASRAYTTLGGVYTLAFQASGESVFATENYFGISANVASKGKTKITGVLPDGQKLSTTAKMMWTPDGFVVPVVVPAYTGKKGGFAFLLAFDDEGEVSVPYCSSWIVTGKTPFEAEVEPVDVAPLESTNGVMSVTCDPSFEIPDVFLDLGFSPDGFEFEAKGNTWKFPSADSVKFVRDEGWTITRDRGNPTGLKISFTKSTGLFKGTFKVYGETDAGKSKKYTVTINGVVVDGVGYGHALLKKIGSVPLVIEREEQSE